jgi:hypothetical protein
MAEFRRFSKLARPLRHRLHRMDHPSEPRKREFEMPFTNKLAAGFASVAFSVMMLAFAIAPVLHTTTVAAGNLA